MPSNVLCSGLNGVFSKAGTPARKPLIYRRYTGPIHAASATRGNSRQTDFKGRPLQRNVRFCHALSPLSVTGKQRFTSNGSTVPEWLMSSTSSSWTLERRVRAFVSTRPVCAAAGGGVRTRLIGLAVKRRAGDFQPARDFGHLPPRTTDVS